MSLQLYIAFSMLMYLEFAIRGSWAPVLSARLLGPLGMSAKQAGWIYAMYPLACILSPLIAGQLADRWIATEWLLGAMHLVSAIALLAAARTATFWPMFSLIGLHCLFFAPSLGLVNSLVFSHLDNPKVEYFWVRVWASIGWMSIGWALSIWRRSGKFAFRGSDALLLGAMLSFAMAVFCPLCLPHTPPPGGSDWASSWNAIVTLLSKPNVPIFLGISLIVFTQLQFYYFGTSKFLEDVGFRHANVPALMSVAQLAEIVATGQVMPWILPRIGYQWTLTIGPLLWALLYVGYIVQRPRWLVVAAMGLHGFAFAFFLRRGNRLYQPDFGTRDSRHSPVALHRGHVGCGLFLGMHFTGFVIDRLRREGKHRWRLIFMMPCIALTMCALAFMIFFTEQ